MDCIRRPYGYAAMPLGEFEVRRNRAKATALVKRERPDPGRQSVLYQSFRILRKSTLRAGNDQGHSRHQFYDWLGLEKTAAIRSAVKDVYKSFRSATSALGAGSRRARLQWQRLARCTKPAAMIDQQGGGIAA